MTITEANDINTVLHWAMGHREAWPGGPRITAQDATAAARRLTARAQKTLLAGLGPADVTLAAPALLPAEQIAVTVARAQLERGENPPPNTTAVLLLTIGRLTGQGEAVVAAGAEGVSP